MNGLCLFAGSGISELALKAVIPEYRTVCYVENDGYCVAQIASRIADGYLDDAPIWDDVRTFDGTHWRKKVDIVVGGFPCQPFSVAGKNKGSSDERNLWPDTRRIISEVRPRFALLENVPNLLVHEYFGRIQGDLAEIGYSVQYDTLGPGVFGAPYTKDRLWILASLSACVRPQGWTHFQTPTWEFLQFERLVQRQLQSTVPAGRSGRVAVRVANGVDRLSSIGNGWVPQVVANILRARMEPTTRK